MLRRLANFLSINGYVNFSEEEKQTAFLRRHLGSAPPGAPSALRRWPRHALGARAAPRAV
jgi:hypothetical protein